MRLSGFFALLSPKRLSGKIVLFFFFPVFLSLIVPITFFYYSESSSLAENVRESMSFHTQSCASRISRFLGSYEATLKTLAFHREAQRAFSDSKTKLMESGEMLRIYSDVNNLLPEAESVFLTIKKDVLFLPPAPTGSYLAKDENKRTFFSFLKGKKEGFYWSKPFLWRTGEPAVACMWLFSSTGDPIFFGIVLPLKALKRGTFDVAFALSDVSGVFILNRDNGSLWFPYDPKLYDEAHLYNIEDADDSVKLFINRIIEGTSGELLVTVGSEDYYSFDSNIASGNLFLSVLFFPARLDAPLAQQRLAIGLLAIYLFLVLGFASLFFYRMFTVPLSELTIGARSVSQKVELPEPPRNLPIEAMALWHELLLLDDESSKRDIFMNERLADYNSAVTKSRELINTIPDGYVLTREDGLIIEFNSAMVMLSGYEPNRLNGVKLPALLERVQQTRDFSATGGSAFASPNLLLCRKDGEKIPILLFERFVELGNEKFILCLIRDISKEEEIRRGLLRQTSDFESVVLNARQEAKKYRLAVRELIERLHEGVIRIDVTGNVVACNNAAASIFNYPARDELIGMNLFSDLNVKDLTEGGLLPFLTVGRADFPAKVTFNRFDGLQGIAMVSARSLGEEEINLVEVLITDISDVEELRNEIERYRRETETILREHEEELKKTQRQLIDQAHRSGMAEFASEILHNIGNAVNSIGIRIIEILKLIETEKIPERMSNISRAQSETDANGGNEKLSKYVKSLTKILAATRVRLVENAEFINEKLSHISEIILLQQSIASVTAVKGVIENVRIADLILDSVEMNREAMLKRSITISYQFGDVPSFRVEKNKLLQVLVNIVKNAIEAIDMSQGDRKEVEIATSFDKESETISIAVTDSGLGMTKDVLEKVFSFGFTTKKSRGGSGFGLHSALNLLKAMGGSIKVDSEGPERGAKFTIFMPLAPPIGNNARGGQGEAG